MAKRVQGRIVIDNDGDAVMVVRETTGVMVENEEGAAVGVQTAVHGVVLGNVLSQQQQSIQATESATSNITRPPRDGSDGVQGAAGMNQTAGVAVESEDGRAEGGRSTWRGGEVILGNILDHLLKSDSTSIPVITQPYRSDDDRCCRSRCRCCTCSCCLEWTVVFIIVIGVFILCLIGLPLVIICGCCVILLMDDD